MVITGYRINTINLQEIMEQICRIQKKLRVKMNTTYNVLLGEEIAFLNDSITLGMVKENPNISIFEDALNNLNFKIATAAKNGIPNRYNFQVYAHLLVYESYTYIKVVCPNNDYLCVFDKLDNYSLDEIECQDKANNKTATWEKLHKIYSKNEPITINLTQELKYDKEKIKYPSKKERAEMHARHSITNQLLNRIAGGQQISPVLLMSYFDLAIDMLSQNEIQLEYKNKVKTLMQIFNDLNVDDSYIHNTMGKFKKEDSVE